MAAHSSDSTHDSFRRVVALHEAAKQLVARSSHVNLLALDAMVQSKRAGGTLRGFDEVSSQMRMWSRDLHQLLQELGRLGQIVVERTSEHGKNERPLVLLAETAARCGHAELRAAVDRCAAEQRERERTIARDWSAVEDQLTEVDRLGLMAAVLSRSAMIEAASGNAEQRAQLSQVSEIFYKSSQAVLDIVKALLRDLREVRT